MSPLLSVSPKQNMRRRVPAWFLWLFLGFVPSWGTHSRIGPVNSFLTAEEKEHRDIFVIFSCSIFHNFGSCLLSFFLWSSEH